MKKFILSLSLLFVGIVFFYSCMGNQKTNQETILTGNINVLVDETILPVIEDQKLVFETHYKAKVNLIPKSEIEIVQLLSKGKYNVAILTRDLKDSELSYFKNLKIKGKITPFAIDGIAFIANKLTATEAVDINEILGFIKGENQKYKGLVFDNANSSTLRYFMQKANLNKIDNSKVYSFKTNNEVIKFISENPGMVGVVGVNWVMQPLPEFQAVVDKISVLQVKTNNNTFVLPTQDEIAGGLYPVTREIKLLNFQGTEGLGMGFASFVAGEIGQRIILKSGLVPYRMPSRNINIRKSIEKENK